uniref:Flavodoxin family protein n=1 Tax=Fundidesulfovibrio putealis TaxID=270496 RepID=A0A7C3W8K7_9BACT
MDSPSPPWTEPLILACGPRKGGNSDHAARMVERGLVRAGARPRLVHLRDHALNPCRGCQSCHHAPRNACPLMARDETEALFGLIKHSAMLFFTSPIYFYHLPGAFKGFIDRAQRYYEARLAGDPEILALPERTAHACLVAGRPRGEKLFEGSLLTLRYFLWPFNARVGEALTLPGYDGPGDLSADHQAGERVSAFAAACWAARGQRPAGGPDVGKPDGGKSDVDGPGAGKPDAGKLDAGGPDAGGDSAR